MPIYVMHCLHCGTVEEAYFPSMDVTKWRCNTCGSDAYEKLPTKPIIKFKGGGVGGFSRPSSELKGG
jgi:putative FmdB family regulatory protein